MFEVDAHVLKFNLDKLNRENGKPYISLDNILHAEKSKIPNNSNIILATGWASIGLKMILFLTAGF
ncbi:MAG: hypothetical protein ACQEP2_06020 [Actinomycetota bacterium]